MSHKHLLWGAVNIPALTLPIQISYRTTDFDGVADAFKLIVKCSTGMKHLCHLPLSAVMPADKKRADHASVSTSALTDTYFFCMGNTSVKGL